MDLEIPIRKPTWGESLTEDLDPAVESPPESLVVTGAAVAAGMLTNRLLKAAWKRYQGTDPPVNPAAAGVSWKEALIWAGTVGAAIGVNRVLARRTTTTLLQKR